MSPEPLVLVDRPADRVARVTLNRPEKRNAQNTRLLFALDDALGAAARDDTVSVIVLGAAGPDFSAGHDLTETEQATALAERSPTWSAGAGGAAERIMAYEREVYLGLSERWRNLPKPTIAAVQGRCIAGGLMLAWPCDLIVASEDAVFIDNTLAMGMPGCEYFVHPGEVGVRKAKEMLFTGQPLGAAAALALGMVNRVVRRDRLDQEVLELASLIATRPLFGLRLAKQAVNAAEDAAGRREGIEVAFGLHQLAHSHNLAVHGQPVDPSGISPRVRRS
jgi:enoyl-CoA hydratase/carnithine racemase